MTGPATTGQTVRRDWMDWGTASFLGALDRLGDDELDAPTVLPGWTRPWLTGRATDAPSLAAWI